QYLALQDYDPGKKEGRLHAAYGETLGYYADWANVNADEIRERNALHRGRALQPGRSLVIPLQVTPDAFFQQRVQFHQARESLFLASYTVTERIPVRMQRGQSLWSLAQSHNVPMWLIYHENPELLDRPPQAGSTVILPHVVEAVASSANPNAGSGN
ncbi:MAG TPA: LysM peptidoglycan-binding domain-containing protein, partial [bacterium]|nr:LysM peptidoglycan-binding domain-containing protein [bacterium]